MLNYQVELFCKCIELKKIDRLDKRDELDEKEKIKNNNLN